ncbi:hypothetical protein MKZ38_005867 [Zalerion maritima]|uniref:Uncharacterized protein n=1 Tax=Zalerion maritima TaxID=339359 RepID=A0AAD5RJL9_9PEZI|nr:hypothetical protein MKZ38_005867 [Zalerion maritima]
MGVLDIFTPKSLEEQRADSVRSGKAVPERSERQRCWDSRDAYYSCLDRSGIVDAETEAGKALKKCREESARFEKECPAAWVPYFKKWRVADMAKKQKIAKLEAMGALPVNMDSGPGSTQKRTE